MSGTIATLYVASKVSNGYSGLANVAAPGDAFSMSTEQRDRICSRPPRADDKSVTRCTSCDKEFGLKHLRLKHHCANCGQIFCASCTPVKQCIPRLDYTIPMRVCTICLDRRTNPDDPLPPAPQAAAESTPTKE